MTLAASATPRFDRRFAMSPSSTCAAPSGPRPGAARSPNGPPVARSDGHFAPHVPGGKRVAAQAVRLHLRAVAGTRGRDVAAGADDDRVDEVLVEVVDVLDHPAVELAADGDVVEDGEVLDELAQADSTGVRADR